MARETLTDRKVKTLRAAPKGTRRDLWDAVVPGLTLRVTDHGAKSWTVVGRLNRKPLRVTLGSYPALSVAAARVRARRALEMLADGKNPRRSPRTTPVFSKALDLYLESRDWKPLYDASVRSAIDVWIVPAFGDMLIVDVGRSDVNALLDEIAEKYPARANSVLAYLAGFFTWALDREMIQTNPVAGMKPPSEHRSRDRVYTDPEIRAIWKASESALGWPYGPFVRFLLVTAQRRAQVRDMKWSELDDARGIWTSATKEGRLHPLPLPPFALAILADAHHLGDFIFSSSGERGVTNMSFLARKIREAPGTPKDFRLHDLRRTAATRMAELGVPPWTVDAVLDHAAGGVTRVYQRYGYVDEMRQALALWDARLRDILAVTA